MAGVQWGQTQSQSSLNKTGVKVPPFSSSTNTKTSITSSSRKSKDAASAVTSVVPDDNQCPNLVQVQGYTFYKAWLPLGVSKHFGHHSHNQAHHSQCRLTCAYACGCIACVQCSCMQWAGVCCFPRRASQRLFKLFHAYLHGACGRLSWVTAGGE